MLALFRFNTDHKSRSGSGGVNCNGLAKKLVMMFSLLCTLDGISSSDGKQERSFKKKEKTGINHRNKRILLIKEMMSYGTPVYCGILRVIAGKGFCGSVGGSVLSLRGHTLSECWQPINFTALKMDENEKKMLTL